MKRYLATLTWLLFLLPILMAAPASAQTIDPAFIPDFVGSGPSHINGGVPDPGSTTGLNRVLSDSGVFLALTGAYLPATGVKIDVSSADTTADYLFNKLVAGTGITLTKNNPGANETITINSSGGSPTGAAGGDLNLTYPNPGVAKINGATLGTTTATSGNVLIGSGTQWVTNPITGDITLSSTGVVGVTKINGVGLGSTTATSANVLIADGTNWITRAFSGDFTITNTGVATLKTVGTAQTIGDTNHVAVTTTDAYGRVTGMTSTQIKRHVQLQYIEPSATGVDLSQVFILPYDLATTSVTWTFKKAYLRCESPAAGATTAQVIVSTVGNAALGAGSNLLSSSLTETGTSNYETSTTSTTGTTGASGNKVAVNWSAIGGSQCTVTIDADGQ